MEIRLATEADAERLERLAGRDSARVPSGEILLALQSGRALAAISLESGEAIADPFEPTAAVVAALRAYGSGPHPRRSSRREPGLAYS